MSVRKAHPSLRHRVDVGRGNLAAVRIVTLHIAVPEVVRKYHNDVGTCRHFASRKTASQKDRPHHEKASRYSRKHHEVLRQKCAARQEPHLPNV